MSQKLSINKNELMRRIDEVLHYLWDPIGIAGDPHARDEYSSYANQVFSLVHSGRNADAIAKYLEQVAQEYMGLNSDDSTRKKSLEIAELILANRDYLAAGD